MPELPGGGTRPAVAGISLFGKSGAAAGHGGDLIIIDDPHSEQAVIENSKDEFKKTWAWYLAGPRQRLQPGGSIVVVMTSRGELDLTGQ